MSEYINKAKLLNQLHTKLSEISTVHHDHIEEEIRAYKMMIKEIEEAESILPDEIKRREAKNE